MQINIVNRSIVALENNFSKIVSYIIYLYVEILTRLDAPVPL